MASINENGSIEKEVLRKELENLKNKGTIDNYEEVIGDTMIIFTATKGKDEYEIERDGNVEFKGATIVVSKLTIKNGETVLTESSEKVAIGEPLKVSFKAEIEGGKITSIKVKGTSITNNNGEVEYTTDGSTSVIFEIEAKNEEGKIVTNEYKVNLSKYYNILAIKIGDYVNYTPNTPTEAQLTALNSAVNTYSGYSTTQTLSQTTGMKWRILELDETGTKPKTLISASTTNESFNLNGANGYNNAVYLINEACKTLYSKEGIGEARSITIEDLEAHYSEAGINARNSYTGAVRYGETKRYEGDVANYPNIAKEEKDIGINTEVVEGKNTLRTDGLGGSEQEKKEDGSYKIYAGSGQASANGITVTQTYYYLDSLSNKYDTGAPYYNLFHQNMATYWLASRCVDNSSSSRYCGFDVCCAYSSYISARDFFYSDGNASGSMFRLRPLVSLKSNIETEYEGKADDTYNTWNIN